MLFGAFVYDLLIVAHNIPKPSTCFPLNFSQYGTPSDSLAIIYLFATQGLALKSLMGTDDPQADEQPSRTF